MYFHHAADPSINGLDFALYRAYDAKRGRWLNRDPIGEAGGTNLYAYTGGNPVNAIDPSGHFATIAAGAVIGAAADLSWQLSGNGANISCVNWRQVAGFALLGAAVGGGLEFLVAEAEEFVTVSRWGRPGLQPGEWVMNGPQTPTNYFLSFKWQPGLGNQYAAYSSGESFTVPSSSLQWPSGWGIDGVWKGLFGRRIYVP